MSNIVELSAQEKNGVGTGNARAVRRAGRVPAIIYGLEKENENITVPFADILKELKRPGFFSRLFDIKIGNKAQRTIVQDIQLHPVTDEPLHVDFMRINSKSRVKISVPVKLINHEKSPGLKRGGRLNIVAYRLNVVCFPDTIPSYIEVDLNGLKANDRVNLKNLALPTGVEIGRGNGPTVCTVLAPKGKTLAEANADD